MPETKKANHLRDRDINNGPMVAKVALTTLNESYLSNIEMSKNMQIYVRLEPVFHQRDVAGTLEHAGYIFAFGECSSIKYSLSRIRDRVATQGTYTI